MPKNNVVQIAFDEALPPVVVWPDTNTEYRRVSQTELAERRIHVYISAIKLAPGFVKDSFSWYVMVEPEDDRERPVVIVAASNPVRDEQYSRIMLYLSEHPNTVLGPISFQLKQLDGGRTTTSIKSELARG